MIKIKKEVTVTVCGEIDVQVLSNLCEMGRILLGDPVLHRRYRHVFESVNNEATTCFINTIVDET